MVATGVLAFGAGLLVSEIFDDDDDDYYHHGSHYYPNYHGGYYPPPPRPYNYNPAYGGGYRPGYSYNRPPSYNNVLSNNNVVVVNRNKNDNYWNNFDDRATGKPRAKSLQSPITKANPNRSDLASVRQQGEVTGFAEQEGPGQLRRRKPGSTREGEAASRFESDDRQGCIERRCRAEQDSAGGRGPGLCRRTAGDFSQCETAGTAIVRRKAIGEQSTEAAIGGAVHGALAASLRLIGWWWPSSDRSFRQCSRILRSRGEPEGPLEHAARREEQVEVGLEEAALGETP